MVRPRNEHIRLGVIFALVLLFFGSAVARLAHLQIALSSRYADIVERQSSGKVAIPAERGKVYDCNGHLVAGNVMTRSLYAYPHDSRQLREVAAYVERLMGLSAGSAIREYGLSVRRFRWIRRGLDDAVAERIEQNAPVGLYLRTETSREYPFGTVGRQVLGFTDIDNCGQSGIELSLDSVLAGKKGWADIQRDGLRNLYRVKESALVKPVSGSSVVLTIDWRLQEIVEAELARAVKEHNAESGMAVFMDCHDGDILAMAHFDPSESNPERPVKLRAVADQFEPGSVLKAYTAAGLLDAELISFEDSVYCEEGKWRVDRRVLHDDKEHGWLSFREVIELSSNIGIGKFACELGGDELVETFKRFGIGQKCNIGLPSEAVGSVAVPSRWSDYNVAALAMGHAVAVSTLQLASGFAAIANGGDLLQPQILLGHVDHSGRIYRRRERHELGRVMKESSIDSLQAFLRGVVEHGTATPVNSPLVSIAGKTGTAQIPDLENKRYFRHRFMSSFAGYFPSEAPIIAGAVVLKAPRPVTYGGYTAGPTFRRIAETYLVRNPDLFNLAQHQMEKQSGHLAGTVETPDLVGRDIRVAKELAGRRGLKLRSPAAEGTVVWQFPPADRIAFDSSAVIVAVELPGEEPTMPDLRGLSLRQASAFLAHSGITITADGHGTVVRQSVSPGTHLSSTSACRLECRQRRRS